MDIDRRAPAVARHAIEIAASPEVVWEVLTNIEDWPSWNPDVRSVKLDGGLVPGSTFRWKAGPGTITSTLQEVEPPRTIGWTGKTLGITAIHVHHLEVKDDGATLVTSEESWAGPVVRLLRRTMQTQLQKAIEGGLGHLKRAAESRAAA